MTEVVDDVSDASWDYASDGSVEEATLSDLQYAAMHAMNTPVDSTASSTHMEEHSTMLSDAEAPLLTAQTAETEAVALSRTSKPSSDISSADDSSSDVSSDSDGLDVEVEDDGVDEDDGPVAGPLRTRHEQEELPADPPAVTLFENETLQEAGRVVSCMLDQIEAPQHSSAAFYTILIQSNSALPGLLTEGSVLCLNNLSVLGPIQEVFGPITNPYYVLRLKQSAVLAALSSAGNSSSSIEKDSIVYTTARLAVPLTTQQLVAMKTVKGSDASNAYDEEIPEDEQEYSDDENELVAKRAAKQAARAVHTHTTESSNDYSAIPPEPRSVTGKRPRPDQSRLPNPQRTSAPASGFAVPSMAQLSYHSIGSMPVPRMPVYTPQQIPFQYPFAYPPQQHLVPQQTYQGQQLPWPGFGMVMPGFTAPPTAYSYGNLASQFVQSTPPVYQHKPLPNPNHKS